LQLILIEVLLICPGNDFDDNSAAHFAEAIMVSGKSITIISLPCSLLSSEYPMADIKV